MTDSKKARLFSIIAAVCTALTGILVICYCMALKGEGLSFEDFFSDWYHFGWAGCGYVQPVQLILTGILYFGLAILLLIGRKNIGFLIVTGLLIFSGAFDIYQYIQCWSKSTMNVQHLYWLLSHGFLLLSYVFLFVLFLLHIIPSVKGKIGKMSVFHFVPAGLFFVGKIGALLGYSCNVWINSSDWTTHLDGFGEKLFFWHWEGQEWLGFGLLPAAGIAMMIFHGLWLMKTAASAWQNVNIIGQADKLKTYKELMDAEMITREEFDEKKKDILGL